MAPYPNCYLSIIEKTTDYHRSRFIIHLNSFYFAEFETGAQLDFFMKTVGLTQGELIERVRSADDNLYQSFRLNCSIEDGKKFWTLAEIPEGAKPIKALSNGSIVTCYYWNDGETLHFYRPNPNAPRSIYDPLPLDGHLAHVRIYGIY